MNILVTGAAGFIGAATCRVLLEQGHSVTGLDNLNDYYDVSLKMDRLQSLGVDTKTLAVPVPHTESLVSPIEVKTPNAWKFYAAHIEDFQAMSELFARENFDTVIHLAAQAGVRYSIENPHAYAQSNLVGFLNILECCRHHKIGHLIYASSSSVYGDDSQVPFSTHVPVEHPVSLYAATKKSNELMAHSYSHLYGIPTTGLRFFTVYGPWGRPDMAPILFASALQKGEPIKVFNEGKMQRDFTYIDDIVQGVVTIANQGHKTASDSTPASLENSETKAPYRIYNIGKGKPEKLMEFIGTLETHLHTTAEKIMMPMQPGDVHQTWADTKDLEDDYGYRPDTTIEEGVANFCKWFQEYYG